MVDMEDDAVVEDEFDGPPDTGQAMPKINLINANPNFMLSTFYAVLNFFQAYGWFIVFTVILAIVIWTNIEKSVKKLFSRKKSNDVTDNMSPRLIEKRMEAMERARLQMQEKYEAEARVKLEKKKQMEEEKRLRLIADHDALKSGKSQSATLDRVDQAKKENNPIDPAAIKSKNPAKPLRPADYNPLTGTSNNSQRWRPGTSRPRAGG